MSNPTLKNFGQSGNQLNQTSVCNFLESTSVDELDDTELVALSAGAGFGTLGFTSEFGTKGILTKEEREIAKLRGLSFSKFGIDRPTGQD